MNIDRLDDITYDENWQSFDEPLTLPIDVEGDAVSQQQLEPEKKKKRSRVPTLIGIQLFICFVVAFSIFILKAIDSNLYDEVSRFYHNQMRNTLVSNKKFEDIDLSEYFNSTDDQATPSQYEN